MSYTSQNKEVNKMKYRVTLIMEGAFPGAEERTTIEVDSTTYDKVVDILTEYAKSKGFNNISELYSYQIMRQKEAG